MKHVKVQAIADNVQTGVSIQQQSDAIEQLRVDILNRKKALLDMQYRLGQSERGLEYMKEKVRKAG